MVDKHFYLNNNVQLFSAKSTKLATHKKACKHDLNMMVLDQHEETEVTSLQPLNKWWEEPTTKLKIV